MANQWRVRHPGMDFSTYAWQDARTTLLRAIDHALQVNHGAETTGTLLWRDLHELEEGRTIRVEWLGAEWELGRIDEVDQADLDGRSDAGPEVPAKALQE